MWALSGTTAASFDGTETVRDWRARVSRRGTVRRLVRRASTGGAYVRRVRFAKQDGNDISPGLTGYGRLMQLELWDFGVPMAHLDWSRLPDFTASP